MQEKTLLQKLDFILKEQIATGPSTTISNIDRTPFKGNSSLPMERRRPKSKKSLLGRDLTTVEKS
jgi:hypothetical protein